MDSSSESEYNDPFEDSGSEYIPPENDSSLSDSEVQPDDSSLFI